METALWYPACPAFVQPSMFLTAKGQTWSEPHVRAYVCSAASTWMDVWSDVAREPQRRLVVLANRLYFFADTNDEVRSKVDKKLHCKTGHVPNCPMELLGHNGCGLDSGSTDLFIGQEELRWCDACDHPIL